MEKKYHRALTWFDRDYEKTFDFQPVQISQDRIAAARQFLQENSGINLNSLHDASRVDVLISEPLGKTAECLTAEELSKCVHSHLPEPSSHSNLNFVTHVVTHISSCEDCWNNLELYEKLEQRSLARACRAPINDNSLPVAIWIGAIGEIKRAFSPSPCFQIPVTTLCPYGERTGAIGDVTLKVTYPFESKEISLQKIKPWKYEQPQGSFLINSFYESDEISAISRIEAGTFGYVNISQKIAGKVVYATRVIRFQK